MENEMLKAVEALTAGKKFAIGNDLVFVQGFQQSLTDQFKKKVYTAAEIAYCSSFADSLLRYASTWAAKEAVYKAVKQLDNAVLGWNKIEITRERAAGRPYVTLHKHPVRFNISLTISHDGDYVWAAACVEPIF